LENSRSICLDTSVLINNLRGEKETLEFIRNLENDGATLSTTTINSFELFYGAYRSKRQERNLTATRTLLNRLILLDLTGEASDEAGHILASLEKKGEVIGFRDALIAAIAITHKMTLATNDTEHFKRISSLQVLAAP
jgi:tRNA(fMet)-specific endonuclease VapC